MKQLMKSMEANPMRLLAGACSLVLTLCLSQAGVAQQAAGAAPAAAAAPAKTFPSVAFSSLAPGASQTLAKPVVEEEEEIAKPQKPGTEGLKVHGHWKIVAKNPDGTVANTVEFENSLVGSGNGDNLLASLLIGQLTAGEWEINFSGTPGLCAATCTILGNASATDTLGQYCSIGGRLCFGGLTTTITPFTATSNTKLTFAGTFTAASAGSIGYVATGESFCESTAAANTIFGSAPYTPVVLNYSPQSCQTAPTNPAGVMYYAGVQSFTGTGLSAPFQFTAGQLVQVSVTISFS